MSAHILFLLSKMWVIMIAFSTLILKVFAKDGLRKCPKVETVGILNLPFRPAYLAAAEFDGEESLFVSSFFNIAPNPQPPPPFVFENRDLVAQVFDLEDIEENNFPFANPSFREISDINLGQGQLPETVWPNALIKVPHGVLPFEAILSAQGFHSPIARLPGRLVAINMDSEDFTEYVISQSSQLSSGFDASNPLDPNNSPRFYHTAVFYDMNGDGYEDIITVRSGLRVVPPLPYPPFSELVWFQNPGNELDPNREWTENILYGGPDVDYQGPDIDLLIHDFDNDGVPEFVATHFFWGAADTGKIALYGAPKGGKWSDVNALNSTAPKARTKDLVIDQGKPFSIEFADLNGDRRNDILCTNHQPDGTVKFPSQIPGRVYAMEQPKSGDIFMEDWKTHVLLDNIRPNPSLPNAQISRYAPGFATAIHLHPSRCRNRKPWILVGGDEASKVWVLSPKSEVHGNWMYRSKVIFDINEFYGSNTTQSLNGFSSIGKIIAIPSKKKRGNVLVLIPVFEAKDVHVLRLSIQ